MLSPIHLAREVTASDKQEGGEGAEELEKERAESGMDCEEEGEEMQQETEGAEEALAPWEEAFKELQEGIQWQWLVPYGPTAP